jgi:hypothetical protein
VYLPTLHQHKHEFYHSYQKTYLIQNKVFHKDQTGSDTQTAYCPAVTGTQQPGSETDHSPPSSAKVKSGGNSTPHVFMTWRLIKQTPKGQIYLYLLYLYFMGARGSVVD